MTTFHIRQLTTEPKAFFIYVKDDDLLNMPLDDLNLPEMIDFWSLHMGLAEYVRDKQVEAILMIEKWVDPWVLEAMATRVEHSEIEDHTSHAIGGKTLIAGMLISFEDKKDAMRFKLRYSDEIQSEKKR